MKFVLVVEGQTEAECAPGFLKRWLDPRLKSKVAIEAVWLDGFGNFKAEIRKAVERSIAESSGAELIAVIGLLDLYGLDIFPAGLTSARDRESWARSYFEETVVDNERFRMFFAVHEFEAWLLGHNEVLPREVREHLPRVAKEKPEKVDFNHPPAKLLDRLYRRYMNRGYQKVKDGKALFNKIEVDVARGRCPRLNAMLEELLELAHRAGL